MAFRIVMIENNVSLSLKLNNVIVTKEGKDLWIPIDDISVVIIDNLSISITTRILCALSEKGVAVIICNQQHLPSGVYYSYDNHTRMSKILKFQLEKEQDFYAEFWVKVVSWKITNQANVLKLLDKDETVQKEMCDMILQIKSGDTTNREAHAAKLYFNCLMNSTFSRGNEDILLNSGLDYTYAIIRAYIARVCVGYGLNTHLGIHHKNEYNSFNLVDDLMEPIRPFVDLYAYKLLLDEEYFKPEHRRKLVNILNHIVFYNNKKMYLCNMIEEYVEQFASMIAGRRESVVFPDILEYKGEEYEI